VIAALFAALAWPAVPQTESTKTDIGRA